MFVYANRAQSSAEMAEIMAPHVGKTMNVDIATPLGGVVRHRITLVSIEGGQATIINERNSKVFTLPLNDVFGQGLTFVL